MSLEERAKAGIPMLRAGGYVDMNAGKGQSAGPGPGIVTPKGVLPCRALLGWHHIHSASQVVITVDDHIHTGMEQVHSLTLRCLLNNF